MILMMCSFLQMDVILFILVLGCYELTNNN